jgi:3-oxoacyl-[acyl-carrier-protein] synthase-1
VLSYILDYNCVTPLGNNLVSTVTAIENGVSGIGIQQGYGLGDFYASVINYSIDLIKGFTRLETLMIQALDEIIERNPLQEKSLLMISTTKGNVSALSSGQIPEDAYLGSLASKINRYFGFSTEPIVVSNACVSGILAISVAKRLIQAGLYNHVYILAGDEVTEFVVSGFTSFQAVSPVPCKPYDADRAGVTLGEATAAVLVSKEKGDIKILGDGSINDANHISGPSRTGEGLVRSIQSALKEARVEAEAIDFISAHGTATPFNDEMEAIAFDRLGMNKIPLNSLKGYFGHTLGASGLLESIISFESMKRGILYPSLGFENLGVSKEINVISKKEKKDIKRVLKTASGFGGANTAVIFEKVD